jgi:hypothetical protein
MPSLVELRRLLAQSADARALDECPDESAATDAKLVELLTPILRAGQELAEWLALHEAEGDLSLTAAWHDRLVLVEARDAGTDLPKPESERADAAWAARLLAPPTVEWGADADQDGRRLWVALSTHRQRLEATRL